MAQILIAYFSHSGTTKRIAQFLHEKVGGDIYEIRPLEPYPEEYSIVIKQVKKERLEGFRPALLGELPDISAYDRIFIGSPNWWGTVAPPVATFLESLDFTGKTILPFVTHGGGRIGTSFGDIKEICPKAKVLETLDGNQGDNIEDWLSRVDML
ncbi:MAG: NAD(P)H-dependent oxidoreductase [Lachnospiraceae bacterium]|jgi:flavodoxin|nr:NAD(P)H-dependent oxidoreductase [Lachnospiraceae bacterium]